MKNNKVEEEEVEEGEVEEGVLVEGEDEEVEGLIEGCFKREEAESCCGWRAQAPEQEGVFFLLVR